MNVIQRMSGVLCLLVGTTATSVAETARFPWLNDLGEARALASEQGKPLLIVFRCEP